MASDSDILDTESLQQMLGGSTRMMLSPPPMQTHPHPNQLQVHPTGKYTAATLFDSNSSSKLPATVSQPSLFAALYLQYSCYMCV